MIPKTIHYCWFGGKPLPKLAQICIASWRKYLPDYEIKEWNESNFDVTSHPFTAGAYAAKKYAFVTDYVRLYALRNEGGIYMDTDVEVLQSLDKFLHHPAFSGYEPGGQVPTGIMASEKDGKWVNFLLKLYDGKEFTPNEETNTALITRAMSQIGFELNNQYQEFENMFVAYPCDFFCPLVSAGHKLHLTKNTHCIHHFAGSWLPHHVQLKTKIMRILPEWLSNMLHDIKRKINTINK